MDETPSPIPQKAQLSGGTVEPANRAAIAKNRFQAPLEKPGVRYELRDPFFDVTYRANTLEAMTAKADQMGATRFIALDTEGARTPIQKIDGAWHHSAPLPPLPQRVSDPMTTRDDMPYVSADPLVAPAVPNQALAEKSTAKTIAQIDAEAERAAMVARIESSLVERYIIKRAPVSIGEVHLGSTEYRFRGDSSRVAFTESTFKLATDTNSPSVARSMVDLAQARSWSGLRVSGAEDFRRLVWLEASVRGVKAVGYEPNTADLDVLRREREARQTNRIEPALDASHGTATTASEKTSVRGGGRKAIVSAIEAVLIAKNVPEAKRQAVLAAASEQLAQRARIGAEPEIRSFDRSIQQQLPITPPTHTPSIVHDRPSPTHTR